MKQRNRILGFVIVLLLMSGCQKPESYPIVPSVSFQSVEIRDGVDVLDNKVKQVRLTLYVIDGDGNVGLNEWDTLGMFDKDSLYHNDLFITLLEKKNGVFDTVDLAAPHNYRIPFLQPEGQNKAVKGNIYIDIEYNIDLFDYDTIKYSFFLVDLDLNISNVDTSLSIPADFIGIIKSPTFIQ